MKHTEMDLKDTVYEAVLGTFINEEDYKISGIKIENAFEEDSACSKCYENIYNAKMSLYNRLKCKNNMDDDVDTIMMQWNSICREIAYKMFEYGYLFSKEGK